MRDFPSCFGESSVTLSEFSCSAATSSGSGSSGGGSITSSTNSFAVDRSLQAVNTCIYKAILSTRKEIIIKLIWSKSNISNSLSIAIEDGSSFSTTHPSSIRPPKPGTTGTPAPSNALQHLHKKKGSRSFVTESTVLGLYWDTSAAKYGLGPEPVKDFYVAVIADAEFSLLLGDMSRDFVRKFEDTIPVARFSLLCRKEQIRGTTMYATRSRFRDEGREHEIVIQCRGDEWDAKEAELTVSIDKKKVVSVRRLKWNFRGNQTIFVDGAVVDMMWDIHDWWFCTPAGSALFMFKTRTSSDTHLWLDDDMSRSSQTAGGGGGGGGGGFFLLIRAYKRQ